MQDSAALASKAQPIASVVGSAASFSSSVKQISSKEPAEPSANLAKKDRWLVCTVKNLTDFPILTMASYMDSGRYDDPPKRVEPFETMTFTCCEGDNTFMTGVSGGQAFYINLDQGNNFYFALGFTNPYAGTYKASAVKPATDEEIANLKKDGDEGTKAQRKLAEEAYNKTDQSGNAINSPYYKTKDKDGKEVVLQFQISATAGKKPIYTITEVRNYQSVV